MKQWIVNWHEHIDGYCDALSALEPANSAFLKYITAVVLINLVIWNNFYSAVAGRKSKSKTLSTTLTCQRGTEDVGLENALSWCEVHDHDGIQMWSLENVVLHKKIITSQRSAQEKMLKVIIYLAIYFNKLTN